MNAKQLNVHFSSSCVTCDTIVHKSFTCFENTSYLFLCPWTSSRGIQMWRQWLIFCLPLTWSVFQRNVMRVFGSCPVRCYQSWPACDLDQGPLPVDASIWEGGELGHGVSQIHVVLIDLNHRKLETQFLHQRKGITPIFIREYLCCNCKTLITVENRTKKYF